MADSKPTEIGSGIPSGSLPKLLEDVRAGSPHPETGVDPATGAGIHHLYAPICIGETGNPWIADACFPLAWIRQSGSEAHRAGNPPGLGGFGRDVGCRLHAGQGRHPPLRPCDTRARFDHGNPRFRDRGVQGGRPCDRRRRLKSGGIVRGDGGRPGGNEETSAKIGDAIAKSERGVSLSNRVAAGLNGILEKVRQLDELVAQITAASKEQCEDISQINQAVGRMEQITQDNAATTEEKTQSISLLTDQTQALEETVQSLGKPGQGTANASPAKHSGPSEGETRTAQPKSLGAAAGYSAATGEEHVILRNPSPPREAGPGNRSPVGAPAGPERPIPRPRSRWRHRAASPRSSAARRTQKDRAEPRNVKLFHDF